MRIPLSESEIGYFYKIGKGYFFCRDYEYCYARNIGCRKGTYKEFKELYPYTMYKNGSITAYRVKSIKDRY